MENAPNSKDFKILLLSNAPWSPSGYGVQTKGMAYDWLRSYNVRVLANYGLQGAWMNVNGLTIYPTLQGDDHGDRTARLIFQHWNPDLFITLYDIWMGAYAPEGGPIHPHWVPQVMVDHDPIPEATLAQASQAYRVVVPTRFGQDQFERRGVEATYIPFGVETDVFKPTADKAADKVWLNSHSQPVDAGNSTLITGDSFVLGVVGANKDPYRKGFDRSILALQIFLEQNPDAQSDTRLYVHSWMRMARDIPHLAKTLAMDRYCRGTPDYYNLIATPTGDMARVYGAMDLFVHPSQGGGFEIPILEALSCGVPVAGSQFVSMTELIRDHGWLIPPIRAPTGAKSLYFTPLDATQMICDEYVLADAIEDAYNHQDKREGYGKAGRDFALNFDWGLVNPMWHRLFEEVRAERRAVPLEARTL